MVRHAFQSLQDVIESIVVVVCNDLEWGKDFCGTQFKVVFLDHLFQWHENGSGLACTVFVGNSVVGKFLASKQNLGPRKTSQAVGMVQELLSSDSQSRARGEVVQGALGCICLDFFD